MAASWIELWRGIRIFVLGDVMLDRFVYGNVERISPEAPVPVLNYQSEIAMLGGAGNVARNIVALGGEVILAGALGGDLEGDLIAGNLCVADGITGRFVRVADHTTTVKIRYVSGGHQIMRLDVEQPLQLEAAAVDMLCQSFIDCADSVAAVVLSDYAKGVLDPGLIRRVVDIARARRLPVIVDPKSADLRRYAGATVLTPNAAEAVRFTGIPCQEDANAEAAAKVVCELADVKDVVLTRGAQGMTVWAPADAESATHIASAGKEIYDVTGAGDTVVAVLALGLAAGASTTTAARVANVAAGMVVGKQGTAVIKAHELAIALNGHKPSNPKIVNSDQAGNIIERWKSQGLTIGFTNGCFDLIHPGHIELLKHARTACDRLVVALNDDASVKRLKGDGRPVQDENSRAIVMASIEYVDLVTHFAEDTPISLIRMIRPDVLIKGADYTVATVVGAEFVVSYGGRVILTPLEPGHSTSSAMARAALC